MGNRLFTADGYESLPLMQAAIGARDWMDKLLKDHPVTPVEAYAALGVIVDNLTQVVSDYTRQSDDMDAAIARPGNGEDVKCPAP